MNSGNEYNKWLGILFPMLLQWMISAAVFAVMERWCENPLMITAVVHTLTAGTMGMIYRKDRGQRQGYEKTGRLAWYWYLLPVVLGICSCIVINGLMNLCGLMRLLAEDYKSMSHVLYESSSLWLSAAVVVFAAPLAEELLFRGLCFRRARQSGGFVWSMLISAVLFGVYHGNLAQCIYGFLTGLVFAWSYERFRRLSAPVLLHMSANTCSLLLSVMPKWNQLFSGSALRLVFSVLIFTLIGLGCFYLIQNRMYHKEKET